SGLPTFRIVASVRPPIWPRSIREHVEGETPAARARSTCRQPRRSLTRLNARPRARSSTGRSSGTVLTCGPSAAYRPLRRLTASLASLDELAEAAGADEGAVADHRAA